MEEQGEQPTRDVGPPITLEVTPAPSGLSTAMTGLRWRTALGDLVEVWQAGELGRPVDWRWHVQARNGEILEQGEGHTRRRNARVAAMRYHPPVYPGTPTEPPASLVAKLLELLEHDDTIDVPPTRVAEVAARWAAELAPLLVQLPALPADQVETTWPAAWFSYVDTAPDVGEDVLVDGVPYKVAGRFPDGVPDRIRVRLTRSEARRA